MRKWHLDAALHSVRSLVQVISELTLEECEAALELESVSRRRQRIMTRLFNRAVELNSQHYVSTMKVRYSL